MSCIEFGLNLSPKIAAHIDDVAQGDFKKARIMAMFLDNNQEFIDYIKKDEIANKEYEEKGLDGINGNTLKRLLRNFYNIKFPSVSNYVSGKAGTPLYGFSDSHAAVTARNYVADIISDLVRNSNTEFRSRSDFYVPIRTDLTKKYQAMVIDIVNSPAYTSKRDGYIKRRAELIDDARDTTKTAEERNKSKMLLFALDYSLIRHYGELRQKNFAQLIRNIRANDQDFMDYVFNASKLDGVVNKSVFDGTENYDEVIASDEEDLQLVNSDSDAVDNMMREFGRDNAIKGSFDKIISDDVKYLFNSIVNLESADSRIIDTNNPLGVPTRMNYREVMQTLINKADKSSIDNFIESIKDIAYKDRSKAGLINLYDILKNNSNLANKIYTQLNKPKVKKAIISVAGNEINIDQSNRVVNPETSVFYDSYNRLKFTIQDESLQYHISMISSALYNIDGAKKAKEGIAYDNNLASANEKIKNVFAIYLSNISQQDIDSYLNYGNKIDNYRNLVNYLTDLLQQGEDVVQRYDEARANSFKNKSEAPTIDEYFSGNFSNALDKIVKTLTPFIDVKNELNSRNAEGNIGSDVINASWITSIVERIQYGNKEDSFAGLRTLGEFYIKSPATHSNHILFDQFDEAGNQLSYGMFRKTGDSTFVINDYAKDILDAYLYAGMQNNDTGKASSYASMSTADYLVAMLTAFTQPISRYDEKSRPFSVAGYMARTPSDAPKNYIFRAPKYSISDLLQVDDESFNKYKKKFYDKNVTYNVRLDTKNTNNVKSDVLIDLITDSPNEIQNNNYKVTKLDNNAVEIKFTYTDSVTGHSATVKFKATRTSTGKFINVTRTGIESNGTQLPIDITTEIDNRLLEYGIREGIVNRNINRNSAYYKLVYNQLTAEMEAGFKALSVLSNFERRDGKTYANFNKDIMQLSDRYYRKGDTIFDDNGELVGNAFKYYKLYATTDFDINTLLSNDKRFAFLYGGTEVNSIYSFDEASGTYKLNLTDEHKAALENIVDQWMKHVSNQALNYVRPISNIVNNKFNDRQIEDLIFNQSLAYMAFDDIFEGNAKYYKDPQDLFKRNKEIQAGGEIYGGNNFDRAIGDSISITGKIEFPRRGNTAEADVLTLRNGFKAITIKNTVRPSKRIGDMRKYLERIFMANAKTDEEKAAALQRIQNIINGFADKTTANDAQSYITIDEFIRRRILDGTYDKYENLIKQLVDPNVKPEDINYTDVAGLIQVQKNFYYDQIFDPVDGLIKPRQIKNAEFVLIPKLLPENSSLRELYDMMVDNDIDQINTVETDKAAKRNVLKYWDNDGNVTAENKEKFANALKNGYGIENYYYNHLYKQQEVPDHMRDSKNKLAVQISKKIFDNVNTGSQQTKDAFNKFQKAYVAKIKRSFNKTIRNLGLEMNPDGSVKAKHGIVNVENIYRRAREEAQRLGVDSNFLEYLSTDKMGSPLMPNWMNNVSVKLENIAQAIFNRGITRQMLPGWHAAQVTNVGYSDDLEYHPTVYNEVENPYKNVKVELTYTPDTADANGMGAVFIGRDENGNAIGEFYIDAYYDFNTKSAKSWRKKDLDENKVSLASIGQGVTIDEEFRGKGYGKAFYYQIAVELGKQGKTLVSASNSSRTEDANRVWKSLVKDGYAKKVNDHYEFINNKILSVKQEAYMEVRLPRWSKLIPESMRADELPNDLQFQIAYRIPTEGKQSVVIIKVKEFLPEAYGSTIVVPDEWVTQTGSDFDIDSVYGIGYNIAKRTKSGELFKIEYNDKTDEENTKLRYELYKLNESGTENLTYEEFKTWSIEEQNTTAALENQMVDALKTIMSDDSSMEEHLGRSKYDDLRDAANKVNKIIAGRNNIIDNPYNPLSQIENRAKAQEGATLKAFSVNRDTFNSICNVGEAYLNADDAVTVVYPKNDNYDLSVIKSAYDKVKSTKDGYVVTHNRFANSKNNRNIVGQLITAYSSQTTAHILDAVKVGSLFNENKFTFGTFKTLIDLGIDYYTAELFLAQPGVSAIVEAYNSLESQVVTSYGSEINTALKNIAIQFGVKLADGSTINKYTPTPMVIEALNKVSDVKIPMTSEEFIKYKVVLNQQTLENNLKSEPTLSSVIKNILDFNKLYTTTRKVEANMQCCNPDKFGAKQSIKSTRDVLDRVAEYREKLTNGDILTVRDGRNLIDALYPLDSKGNIDVDNSFYPYIAAFMRYATKTSVEVNKLVFALESDYVSEIIKALEKSIHTKLTPNQYRELQQYAVNFVCNMCEGINEPITLNEFNQFVVNSKRIEEDGKLLRNRWDREQLRIRGLIAYETANETNFNFVEPTQDDIDRFTKLTPVQKVMAIQTAFARDQGVFEHIKVNTSNTAEIKSKGISGQYMYFNDQAENIENIFTKFNQAAYSKNPLIRLAAYDLLKYSFVVEGFKFKKSSISKIITAQFLKQSLAQKGTNIVGQATKHFATTFDLATFLKGDNQSYDMFEKFVRQNPNVIKLVTIPKRDTRFNKLFNNGIIEVPFNELGYEFLDYTGYATVKDIEDAKTQSLEPSDASNSEKEYIDVQKYIRIQRTMPNGSKSTILYKSLYKPGVGLFYYPLNLLDANEINDVSVNPKNNKYYIPAYYEGLIEEAAKNYTSVTQFLIENPKYLTVDNLREYVAGRIVQPKSGTAVTDTNAFVKRLGTQDKYNFVNRVLREFTDIKDNTTVKIIPTMNTEVRRMLPNVGDVTIQDLGVSSTGEQELFSVKRIGRRKALSRAFINRTPTNIKKLNAVEKAIYDEFSPISQFAPTLYEVKRSSPVEEHLGQPEVFATTTEIPLNDANSEVNKLNEIDRIALRVYNDIKRKARKNPKFERVLDIFKSHGIEDFTTQSITENTNVIFARAANLYRDLGNYINSEINNFQDTGLSIDNIELYERAAEDKELLQDLVSFLLEARTIGKSFDPIFRYDVTSLDSATARNLDTIKKSINSIRNNIKVVTAMKNVFDITFAQFSRNPVIKEGLVNLHDQFGDADWFDSVFSDIHELNNSQIQVVLRFVEAQVEKVRMKDIPESVKAVRTKIADIIAKDSNFNWNNVRRNNKFVTPYNEKFIEDRLKYNDAVKEARYTYGEYSVEYYKKLLEKDKWYNDNVEQKIQKDYYTRKNAYLTNVLKYAPDHFVRYKYIMHELYGTGNFNRADLSDEQLKRRHELVKELRLLRSDVYEDDTMKSMKDLHKSSVLNTYIESMRNLNEEYFEKEIVEGFEENLEYYLDIIKRYEANHPYETLDERLKDDNYLDAYNWLKANTIRRVDAELRDQISQAFKDLGANYEFKNAYKWYLDKHPEIIDGDGVVDGTKIPQTVIEQLKKDFERRYAMDSDNPHVAATIREVPADRKQVNAKFWADLGTRQANAYDEILDRYNQEINSILEKAVDDQGHISSKKLFDLGKDTVQRLAELYDLSNARKELLKDESDKGWRKKFANAVTFKHNTEAFNREYNWALTNLTGDNLILWSQIFAKWEKGTLKTDKENQLLPGDNVFGYFEPKDEKYVNNKRAEAIKFIQDNIEFVPTEYYTKAMNLARKEGRWEEWFRENHVFNPYTGKYEPLTIWTNLNVKDDPNGTSRYKYDAIGDNVTSEVKENKKNDKYDKHSYNYNGNPAYASNIKQSPAEKEMVNYLQSVMRAYSGNDRMLSWVGKDNIPRLRLKDISPKEIGKELLGAAGFSINARSMKWKDEVGYEYDVPADFDMFAELKGKGTKNLINIRPQLSDETDAEYKEYVELTNKQNKEIKKENARIDIELANDNMSDVMETFVARAIEYNAKEAIKPYLYLLLQDLKDNQAYKTAPLSGQLREDRSNSVEGYTEYKKEEQRKNIELVETYINRFIYGEFKSGNKTLTEVADLFQNLTSAKYMIFNHTGGVANVLTGWTNIFGESFAKEFFDNSDWARAHKDYLGSIHYILAGLYDDGHRNLIDGIIKSMNVVNLDEMLERRSGENWEQWIQRARNFLYSMQSSGEHYMQNTAMIAMMYSHKLYQDDKGKWTVGSFAHYAWHKDKAILRRLVADNPVLLRDYNQFAESIDNDIKNAKDYAQFTKDFNVEFLQMYGDKEITRRYIEERDKELKKAKEEFNTFENVKDQFIYDNGVVVVKPDSHLTSDELAKFKIAVISVNKKIHGVYDKIGAANIEKHWWGSVVMQYHKHMYPGIMKRWRRRGYYNEFRGSVERGSYVSLASLLSTEFRSTIKKAKELHGDDTQAVIMESIKNIARAMINTITNLRLNYQTLPEWEKANIRRIQGDLGGIMAGMVGLIALGLLTGGDDDDELYDTTWYNFMLYTADRWITESNSYTPWGLVTEGKTLWSSPVAAFKAPEDLLKLLNLSMQALFDDDFNPEYTTGRYKGENKLTRLIIGNVPLMRNINRLEQLEKNNQYYRLDDNSIRNAIVDNIVDWYNK